MTPGFRFNFNVSMHVKGKSTENMSHTHTHMPHIHTVFYNTVSVIFAKTADVDCDEGNH